MQTKNLVKGGNEMKSRKILAVLLSLAILVTAIPMEFYAQAVEETKTVVDHENAEQYLYFNRYTVNSTGAKMGVSGGSRGDLRWDNPALYEKPTGIYTPIYSSGVDAGFDRWPYIAVKVDVEKDGEYEISSVVNIEGLTPTYDTFGMIVDGVTHVLKFTKGTKSTVTEKVKLSQGTHIIVFTTPMPEDTKSETSSSSATENDYPWFDYHSFTFSEGMTVTKPTRDEIHASVSGSTRIEAENTAYVKWNEHNTTNGYKNIEQGADHSGGAIVGGAVRATFTQSYEDLQLYLDKKTTAYVQYTVEAPSDGIYQIRVGLWADKGTNVDGTEKPFSVVLVNDDVYQAKYTGNWSRLEAVNLAVELKQGINIIRCTALTTDQGVLQESKWISHDYLEIESKLTAVANGTSQELVGEDAKVLSNKYNDTAGNDSLGGVDASLVRVDKPSIETLEDDFNTKSHRWPWTALSVTAAKDGYYDISIDVGANTKSTSKQIGMLVDGKAYCLPFSVAKYDTMIDASVYLTAGSHTIVFTTPMPETKEEVAAIISDSDNLAYSYLDWDKFYFSTGLTVNDCKLSSTTGIEAEDTNYVSYNGNYEVQSHIGVSGGAVAGIKKHDDEIRTYDDLQQYLDWHGTSFVEYKLEAPEDGEYEIVLGTMAKCIADGKNNDKPYVAVLVNGEIYKAQYKSDWNEIEKIFLNVNLKKGENVIRCTAVTEEQQDNMYLVYDYFEYDEQLTAISLEDTKVSFSTVNAGDETKILSNLYADNGDTLGSANLGHLKYDKLSLDNLTVDNLQRIPYAAMKVTAEADGYYDIKASVGVKTDGSSNYIDLMVDGTAVYSLGFALNNSSSIGSTIYLTEGTHILVFTTPMPETKEMADALTTTDEIYLAYPWFDYNSFLIDSRLIVEDVPATQEVQNPFYNRVEAENAEYVVYNGYKSEAESAEMASGGYVIGGVARHTLRQTFEELKEWVDSSDGHTSYVEYAVMAPSNDTYQIRVGITPGTVDKSQTKPFAAVLVNGDVYKAQFTGNWNDTQAIKLDIKLKKGLNIIRVTSLTTDQECIKVSSWINQDYIDLDKRLTALKRSVITAEAENSQYINLYTVNDGMPSDNASGGKVLGSADLKRMAGSKMTVEKLTTDKLIVVPYFSYTVNAPTDGYYSMSLHMTPDGDIKEGYLAMVIDDHVNAVRYVHNGTNTVRNKMNVVVWLEKGEHVLTFTASMPKDSNEKAAYSDRWVNFDCLLLYDGLTLAATQKAPTEISEMLKLEAEEYGLPNMTKIVSGTHYSEGAGFGGAYYAGAQTSSQITKTGIDGRRTPYVEYTIEATKAGNYTVYFSANFGVYKEPKNIEEACVAVSCNGTTSILKTPVSVGKGTSVMLEATLSLQKGRNIVQITHCTSDSWTEEGYPYVDFDYIEITKNTAKDIEFISRADVLEAENSQMDSCAKETISAASGGTVVGYADYAYIDENDITFEKLDLKNLGGMSRVTYTVSAQKAGTYSIAVQFVGGTATYSYNELKERDTIGFAMAVNGEGKQLIEFHPTGTNSVVYSRVLSVDLKEGENTIMFTISLADYLSGYSPRIESEYRLYWINHDALYLQEGLSLIEAEQSAGAQDTDVNHRQLKVKTGAMSNDKGFLNSSETLAIVIIGTSSSILLIILGIYLWKKYKKQKNKSM